MKKEFEKTLEILSELNTFKDNNIYSEVNLEEEKDNIKDVAKGITSEEYSVGKPVKLKAFLFDNIYKDGDIIEIS